MDKIRNYKPEFRPAGIALAMKRADLGVDCRLRGAHGSRSSQPTSASCIDVSPFLDEPARFDRNHSSVTGRTRR
jgi:hypothetical protein